MRATRSLSITLPVEIADMVEAKVASGEYASESDVIAAIEELGYRASPVA